MTAMAWNINEKNTTTIQQLYEQIILDRTTKKEFLKR